jgi:hypothetical protein
MIECPCCPHKERLEEEMNKHLDIVHLHGEPASDERRPRRDSKPAGPVRGVVRECRYGERCRFLADNRCRFHHAQPEGRRPGLIEQQWRRVEPRGPRATQECEQRRRVEAMWEGLRPSFGPRGDLEGGAAARPVQGGGATAGVRRQEPVMPVVRPVGWCREAPRGQNCARGRTCRFRHFEKSDFPVGGKPMKR